jgi:hypothetical protein
MNNSGADRVGVLATFLAGRRNVPNNRFLHCDRPIDAVGLDDQMIQARIFGYIGDAAPVALVFHGFLYRTPADRAVHDEVE